MLFIKSAAIFALAGLAAAAPTKSQPRILQHDDVILPRADGGVDIMKDWEWSHLKLREDKAAREAAMEAKRASLAGETVPVGANTDPAARELDILQKRCEQSSEVQVLTDTNFTDWDVAMSPVVAATGGGASVAVTKGYSITNSINVATTATFTLLKDVFAQSLSIDYGYSWTSTDSQTMTYILNPGQYGVVVSNPYTRRLTGNYLDGCTDSPTVTTFQADSRTSQTYTEMTWPAGPIRLCNNTIYPVPYCVGTGSHT